MVHSNGSTNTPRQKDVWERVRRSPPKPQNTSRYKWQTAMTSRLFAKGQILCDQGTAFVSWIAGLLPLSPPHLPDHKIYEKCVTHDTTIISRAISIFFKFPHMQSGNSDHHPFSIAGTARSSILKMLVSLHQCPV